MMSGFMLLIPFLGIRFFILFKLKKGAIKRASHFPKMEGFEKVAYWIYQLSNVLIIAFLCFSKIYVGRMDIFALGVLLYLLGLILCYFSIAEFAFPKENGLNDSGIYKYSRNPMYLSYFVLFVGCSLLTSSLTLFVLTIVFQVSAHWIILAEERWCINEFGQEYKD